MKRKLVFLSVCLAVSVSCHTQGATPVATYLFNDSFNAEELGAPPLIPVDPIGMNSFENALLVLAFQ